jgi:hypothetical protein
MNDPNNWSGPDGDVRGNGDVFDCPGNALLGRIGSSGTVFPVGSRYLFDASSSGTLYLGINDEVTSDNVGFLAAFVFVNSLPPVSVSDGPSTNPLPRASMNQNFPNPFNPDTSIPFSVETAGRVILRIYDSRGHLVRILLDEERQPGNYEIVWDGRSDRGERLSSGSYFYQIESHGFQSTRKMIALK